MKRIYVGLSVLGMSLLVVFPQELPPEVISYADMILYNGQVLTMDRDGVDFSVTQAVAIRDGRIMATGTDDRILRMAGPRTQKLDLAGTVVMPGAWDTHVHPEGMAKNHFQNDFRRQLLALDLYKSLSIPSPQWNDLPGSLARIRKLAQTAKPGQWVVVTTGQEIEPGDRYHAKSLRAEFDKIAPSNPLVLLETTTHAVVNSVALDMVLKKYRNLRGVFKDDEGNPTGYLYGRCKRSGAGIDPQAPAGSVHQRLSKGARGVGSQRSHHDRDPALCQRHHGLLPFGPSGRDAHPDRLPPPDCLVESHAGAGSEEYGRLGRAWHRHALDDRHCPGPSG